MKSCNYLKLKAFISVIGIALSAEAAPTQKPSQPEPPAAYGKAIQAQMLAALSMGRKATVEKVQAATREITDEANTKMRQDISNLVQDGTKNLKAEMKKVTQTIIEESKKSGEKNPGAKPDKAVEDKVAAKSSAPAPAVSAPAASPSAKTEITGSAGAQSVSFTTAPAPKSVDFRAPAAAEVNFNEAKDGINLR